MKKTIKALWMCAFLYSVPFVSYGLGGVQIGAEYPLSFNNAYTSVTYDGKNVQLEKNTRTEGISLVLGYSYLYLGIDDVQQKFTLDTDENEEIKVQYGSTNIGLTFRFRVVTTTLGFGYGKAYVSCVSGCADRYTDPKKNDVETFLFAVGVTFFTNTILNLGVKQYNTDDFETYSETDATDVMRLKNTSVSLLSIGLSLDI